MCNSVAMNRSCRRSCPAVSNSVWRWPRTLVIEPAMRLLDEPLGALDKNLREGMQVELRLLQRRLGITTVMVTHDQDEALTPSPTREARFSRNGMRPPTGWFARNSRANTRNAQARHIGPSAPEPGYPLLAPQDYLPEQPRFNLIDDDQAVTGASCSTTG